MTILVGYVLYRAARGAALGLGWTISLMFWLCWMLLVVTLWCGAAGFLLVVAFVVAVVRHAPMVHSITTTLRPDLLRRALRPPRALHPDHR